MGEYSIGVVVTGFLIIWLAPVFVAWTVVCAFNMAFVGFNAYGIGVTVLWFWLALGSTLSVTVAPYLEEDTNSD